MKPNNKFLVIGAGLPRTGTLSLMHALEILLPGECYHGLKAFRHANEWCDILNEKYTDEQFKDFMTSYYVAAVDSPFCLYYQRALKLFPDAKVVLTVRDPQSWVNSVNSTILKQVRFSYFPVHIFNYFFPRYLTTWSEEENFQVWGDKLIKTSMQNKQMKGFMTSLFQSDPTKAIESYNQWVNEVESIVPKEKLLKFNVQDGWQPLCEHLGVPTPDVPFPRVNDRKTMNAVLTRNRRRGWLLLYEFITIPLFVYWVYKWTR